MRDNSALLISQSAAHTDLQVSSRRCSQSHMILFCPCCTERTVFLCEQPSFSASPPRLPPPHTPPGAWSASKWSGLLPATGPLVKCRTAAAVRWPWDKLSVNNAAGFRKWARTGPHHSGHWVIVDNRCVVFISPLLSSPSTRTETVNCWPPVSFNPMWFSFTCCRNLINSLTEGAPLEHSAQQNQRSSWNMKILQISTPVWKKH